MKKHKTFKVILSTVSFVAVCSAFNSVSAENIKRTTTTTQSYSADNTINNKGDQAPTAVTADKQSSAANDLELTRQIRQAIVSEDAFSVNFHNIKIVTQNRVVTLQGPVDSLTEKTRAGEIAKSTAGVSRVNNLLTVKNKFN